MNKACIASRLPDAIFSISASSEVLRALRGGRPAERRGVDPTKSLRIGRSPVFPSTDMGRTRAGNLLLTTSQTGIGTSGSAGLRKCEKARLTGLFRRARLLRPTYQLNLKGFPEAISSGRSLARDPEKWEPVFGKDHAETKT